MPRRISDILAEKVVTAIDALAVLNRSRNEIEWEISPALLPRGDGMVLAFMVAVAVPVPASVENDYILKMAPLDDPHADQRTVDDLVAMLYRLCEVDADEARAAASAQANGHKMTPGGLIVP